MLERLDAAVDAALSPLQEAVQSKAQDASIQNKAEVYDAIYLYVTLLCLIRSCGIFSSMRMHKSIN